MKAKDNGSFYSVSFNTSDIDAFARQWPCSGMRGQSRLWAQFDKSSGDLVDLRYERKSCDQSALLALLEDGKAFARKRLGIA